MFLQYHDTSPQNDIVSMDDTWVKCSCECVSSRIVPDRNWLNQVLYQIHTKE
jgi:hypothetical protein